MEKLHPREIDLGLDRPRAVAGRLKLAALPFAVVTVAGTNGKGSTVAMLEAALHAAGYRVGAYTSPHLIDYNERVRVATQPVDDAALCGAFERVERARADSPLTYFEFGTLAAVDLFRMHGVEVAVLEVGLGGRLDAVNVWDADVAVITAIGIDHIDWLGPDRESIGREKAGILRAGRPAVCSDPAPPASIYDAAARTGAQLYVLGRDFDCTRAADGWTWRHGDELRAGLPYPAMRGDYQLNNAAGVLMALQLLSARFPVTLSDLRRGLLEAVLPGRFQTLPGRPLTVLDVAHNEQAVDALAANLRRQRVTGSTIAVIGMLRDKPVASVVKTMADVVDRWHVATLDVSRGASAELLRAALAEAGVVEDVFAHRHVIDAYAAACREAREDDRIVVFGSFYTVGAILGARR